jgi:hypothetical protein
VRWLRALRRELAWAAVDLLLPLAVCAGLVYAVLAGRH